MAVYGYIATDVDAAVAQGTVLADTPRQARDQLRERGLSVHGLSERGDELGHSQGDFLRKGLWWVSRRGKQVRVTGFVRELSTLLGVGMPLLEALKSLAAQHAGWFRTVILLLSDHVAAGTSLAQAMRLQSSVFDSVTIAMTEVGEQSGTLDQVLQQLADHQEQASQLKGKIGGALIYPAIVLAVGVGVSIFLMTYVVPALLSSLLEAGRELPWITQAVKSVSDILRGYWWLLAGVVLAASLLANWMARTVYGRRFWHRALLALPVLGELLRKQAVVRIAFVVSTLMKSGISFEQAIATAKASVGNCILRDALDRCEQAVRAGRNIGTALDKTRAFPATVVQVFDLGQQSGRLEEMLERLAVDYDRQVASAATRLTAVLEPILILLLACVVGAIAFAVILPILEMGNVL